MSAGAEYEAARRAAIKQIVGRGPNAVALREFHRRLNSGVRLRIALRWAFNFELRPAGGRIITRNAASLRRSAVCMFCFVYSVAERTRSLSLSACFFAQSITAAGLFFLLACKWLWRWHKRIHSLECTPRWIKLRRRVKRMKLFFLSNSRCCYLDAPEKLFALFFGCSFSCALSNDSAVLSSARIATIQ